MTLTEFLERKTFPLTIDNLVDSEDGGTYGFVLRDKTGEVVEIGRPRYDDHMAYFETHEEAEAVKEALEKTFWPAETQYGEEI